MLLPAQMTQRGGTCGDSQRITYTPAAGRARGDTAPCELLLTEAPGERGEARLLPAPRGTGQDAPAADAGRSPRVPTYRAGENGH